MNKFFDIIFLLISFILYIFFSIFKINILIFLAYIPLLFLVIKRIIKVKKINDDFIILLSCILLFIINKKIDLYFVLFLYVLINKFFSKNNEVNKKSIIYKISVIIIFLIISIIMYLLNFNYVICISFFTCGLLISTTYTFKNIYSTNLKYFNDYCEFNNIKIKDITIFSKLVKIESVFIDKGVVIKKYKVVKVIPYYKKEEELLDLAVHAEYKNNSKIALALKSCKNKIDKNRISEYREFDNNGIEAKIDDDYIMVGNEKLFNDLKIEYPKVEFIDTTLMVSLNNTYIGTIVLENILDGNVLDLVKNFNKINIYDITLISSDKQKIVKKVANKLGIEKYFYNLTKSDKINLMKNKYSLYISNDFKTFDNIIMCNFKDGDIVINNIMSIIGLINISKKLNKKIKYSFILNLILKVLCIILIMFNLKYYYIFLIIDLCLTIINLKKVKGDL